MKILWLNGLILLTFVNCYHGMPQDGPPAAFSKIKVAVDGFKSVGEALKEIGDKEGLLKELVNTGKTASVFKNLSAFTGKSLSEALIFASTNPQHNDRLFIELQVQYMKNPSSNLGRT